MASHANFEIDIISALSNQLVEAFSKLAFGELAIDEISALPSGQGVYQLRHKNELVYVGKADSLKKRLSEHHHKIRGRHNIDIGEMGFRCLFIHQNWTTLAPEDSLIKYYRRAGEGACAWNGNGFGPHDPGRQRETTNKAPDGFDAQYPIRQDWVCDWVKAGDQNAADVLRAIKGKLPYLLRFQTARQQSKEPHPDYRDLIINVAENEMTARDLLRIVAQALPGWQATAFPSHMILYKESVNYTHGQVIWPA
jgi:predicted GIY-YIG superfamily endonuclease